MRLYKNVGPYHGRQPERRDEMLRQAMRQPTSQAGEDSQRDHKTTTPRAAGIGDVKDPCLTGKGDPYSLAAHGQKKK